MVVHLLSPHVDRWSDHQLPKLLGALFYRQITYLYEEHAVQMTYTMRYPVMLPELQNHQIYEILSQDLDFLIPSLVEDLNIYELQHVYFPVQPLLFLMFILPEKTDLSHIYFVHSSMLQIVMS